MVAPSALEKKLSCDYCTLVLIYQTGHLDFGISQNEANHVCIIRYRQVNYVASARL
jgi:hypothetical protein